MSRGNSIPGSPTSKSLQSKPYSLTVQGVRRWTEASLDEDIAKLFESPEKESLSTVFRQPGEAPTERHHYDESDYRMHRGESFPHMHQPLKATHPRYGKRHRTSARPSQSELTALNKSLSSVELPSRPLLDDKKPPPLTGDGRQPRKVGFYLGDKAQESMESVTEVDRESKSPADGKKVSPSKPSPLTTAHPLSPKSPSHSSPSLDSELSPPVCQETFQFVPEHATDGSPSPPKVRFTLGREESREEGGEPEADKERDEKESRPRHRHKHHHRHHHHHRHRGEDDLLWRQRSGTEMEMMETLKRVPTELEEAVLLQEGDLNLMASHRFDDPRGMRRHKIQPKSDVSSLIHIGRKDGGTGIQAIKTFPITKKLFDHKPHEVFVELDELHKGEMDDMEWKETARWIKYEEDLEEGANRWGKPHVASLSFHSLLNLRKCLEQGTVLLDLEEKELPGIAYRVVEAMVVNDQIKADDKAAVMRALLLRHKHVSDYKQFQFSGLRRNFSSNISSNSLSSLGDDRKMPQNSSFTAVTEDGNHSAKTPLMSGLKEEEKSPDDITGSSAAGNGSITIDFKDGSVTGPTSPSVPSSPPSLEEAARLAAADLPIMKKIPEDAEATTVLVGGVDFLEQPTIAFVRLAEGTILPSLLEVPIPVRFMFVLLGPLGESNLDYHEIGRSISTLMSNQRFHNNAYKAEDRQDLMRSINEFLDDSIVLPPGDWESKSLLPQSFQMKSQQLRKRRGSGVRKSDIEHFLLPLDTRTVSLDEKKFGDPLRRTRRPFGGLINEMKRRYPQYVSDVKDALNPQCLATVVFIYFAALSGAISFGGLLGDKTKNLIGVPETLVATSVSGILFSIFSGQPLMIIGVTGPVLLFDESLFSFCKTYEMDFLSLRVWIGIWAAFITILFMALEGSFLLRYITLFTEEILAALISLIFIYESLVKLVEIFHTHPLQASYCDVSAAMLMSNSENLATTTLALFPSNETDFNTTDELNATSPIPFLSNATTFSQVMGALTNSTAASPTGYNTMDDFSQSYSMMSTPQSTPFFNENDGMKSNQPNTALLSTILMLGTFFIAFFLREFRNGKYLGRTARRALGDFGVPIAIVIMVLLDYTMSETYTQKLQIPEGLSPSRPEVRGWIISPLGTERPLPIWLIFGSIFPALLLFILLFMEVQICELIINKKERMLRKGTGFHIDFLLLSFLNLFCGLIGGPWMSAAIVRAISHIMSLTVMSRTHAPGDKPHILEVKEQRLTNFLVSVVIGVSVGMAPLLRLIPVAVLFGIFIYMGIVSMIGVQFFERLRLLLMPVKHYPEAAFVHRVQTWKMHTYTLIQLGCLVLLWVVKSTDAAIGLPFVLLLMIPFRRQLVLFFTADELRALDGGEAQKDEEDDEPDFYEEALLPG